MTFIDSPAVGESLSVWKEHLKDLEDMPEKDESVTSAIKFAKITIEIMEKQS